MSKALFDRNDIIDKSIDLFWQNGFSASSIQRVVKATGLNPGSIYLAFGNKEGLFREALESYSHSNLEKIRDLLNAAPSIELGLIQLLTQIVEESVKVDSCSCFLIKTQLELADEGNDLQHFAAAKLNEVESLLQSYLQQIYTPSVSQERATTLMLLIFGIRVYGYRQGSPKPILLSLHSSLPWLPWDQTG